MRRCLHLLSPLLLTVGLVFGTVATSAVVALPAGAATPAAAPGVVTVAVATPLAQTATTGPPETEPPGDGNRLSMLPKPNAKGGSGTNLGGLLVGIFLLGGWALLGVYLFHQGKGRRAAMRAALEAEHAASTGGPGNAPA
jgi:hypothetical protein